MNTRITESRALNYDPILTGLVSPRHTSHEVLRNALRTAAPDIASSGENYRQEISMYLGFDIRDHYIANDDSQYDYQYSKLHTCSINPYAADSGSCVYDVEYLHDRLVVPHECLLKGMYDETTNTRLGLKGDFDIENLTRINMAYFVKSSSPEIRVVTPMDWLLPTERRTIEVKAHVPFSSVTKEFLLIYAVPLYFREQLDSMKIGEFWRALGSDLNPIEQTDYYKVNFVPLTSDMGDDMSLLKTVGMVGSSSLIKNTVVQLPSAIDLYPVGQNYMEFWGMHEELSSYVLMCQSRELKRALRRELWKLSKVNNKWKSARRFTYSLFGSTIFMGIFVALQQYQSPLLDIIQHLLSHYFTSFVPIPPPPVLPIETRKMTFTDCTELRVEDDPRWNLFFITRCFWNVAYDYMPNVF